MHKKLALFSVSVLGSYSTSFGVVDYYLNAPDTSFDPIQNNLVSNVGGVSLEDFASVDTGLANPTTFTDETFLTNFTIAGSFEVRASNNFGADQGNFGQVLAGATLTLDPSSDFNYLGFAWTSANSGNVVTGYDASSNELFSVSYEDLVNNWLAAGTLDSVDSLSSYNTADFFFQPVTDAGNNEAYVFLNIISDTGIDRVEFSNAGLKFELDEISWDAGVFVPNSDWAVVPEPSVYAALFGLVGLMIVTIRRRKN